MNVHIFNLMIVGAITFYTFFSIHFQALRAYTTYIKNCLLRHGGGMAKGEERGWEDSRGGN